MRSCRPRSLTNPRWGYCVIGDRQSRRTSVSRPCLPCPSNLRALPIRSNFLLCRGAGARPDRSACSDPKPRIVIAATMAVAAHRRAPARTHRALPVCCPPCGARPRTKSSRLDRLPSGAEPILALHVFDTRVDGLFADRQDFTDIPIRFSRRHPLNTFALPGRKNGASGNCRASARRDWLMDGIGCRVSG